MVAAPPTHGLAASIRASDEDEHFDLGGQTVDTITTTIQSAFQEPFTHLASSNKMIRITFVTGAGKQARQKYDDHAAKAVTSALKECGYIEDRGASCIMECAGCYKLQHDTGKNLKTVIVFPKVTSSSTTTANNSQGRSVAAKGGGPNDDDDEEIEPLLPENSPGYKLSVSSMKLFENMVTNKIITWTEKKGCLTCLEEIKKLILSLENEKLMKGIPLTASEQSFYDTVTNMDEKIEFLKTELHEHVETGNLTKTELDTLLEQNAERIAALQQQNKKSGNNALLTKALQRKELLTKINPLPAPKLRNHVQISKLQKELLPLLKMEENAKGRLLSMKETRALGRKDEILEEIEQLELASKGWFEEDHDFQLRLEASHQEFHTLYNKQMSSSGKKGSSGGRIATIGADTKVKLSGSHKFVTPGESGKGGWATKAAKKKGKLKGSAVFAAMSMDSDSDEDSDDDDNDNNSDSSNDKKQEDDVRQKNVLQIPGSKKTTNTGTAADETADDDNAGSNNTSSKKKSKKKKKKGSKQSQGDGEGGSKAVKEDEQEQNIVMQTISFFQTYILPIFISLLGWLIALLFGKPKKKKNS